jgi:hypothetical protein
MCVLVDFRQIEKKILNAQQVPQVHEPLQQSMSTEHAKRLENYRAHPTLLLLCSTNQRGIRPGNIHLKKAAFESSKKTKNETKNLFFNLKATENFKLSTILEKKIICFC